MDFQKPIVFPGEKIEKSSEELSDPDIEISFQQELVEISEAEQEARKDRAIRLGSLAVDL